MQVTNHSNNKRNMKEELLEAIYGTVERLEQKVDELSASPKNTESESTPVSVSVNISKLEQAILAMAVKEGESIDKLARLREAICIFTDLTKKEASNGEQRSKLLFDAINQVKQELNATSKNVQEKLHAMGNTPQKKIVTHRFEPTSKYVLLFIGGLALSLVISIWGNFTQWREYQDWGEADLKYRALKMVLPSDDPNVRYIEKFFSVCRDEKVIDDVKIVLLLMRILFTITIKWSKWQQLKIALLIAYLKRRMKLKRKLIRNNRQRPSATSASFVSIK